MSISRDKMITLNFMPAFLLLPHPWCWLKLARVCSHSLEVSCPGLTDGGCPWQLESGCIQGTRLSLSWEGSQVSLLGAALSIITEGTGSRGWGTMEIRLVRKQQQGSEASSSGRNPVLVREDHPARGLAGHTHRTWTRLPLGPEPGGRQASVAKSRPSTSILQPVIRSWVNLGRMCSEVLCVCTWLYLACPQKNDLKHTQTHMEFIRLTKVLQ